MKFYYKNWRGKRFITLKVACPEWINSDCPDIYFEDGSRLFKSTIQGVYDLPLFAIEEGIGEKLVSFMKRSDKAFRKKYPECAGSSFDKTMLGYWVKEIEEMIKRGY